MNTIYCGIFACSCFLFDRRFYLLGYIQAHCTIVADYIVPMLEKRYIYKSARAHQINVAKINFPKMVHIHRISHTHMVH